MSGSSSLGESWRLLAHGDTAGAWLGRSPGIAWSDSAPIASCARCRDVWQMEAPAILPLGLAG